MSSNISKLYFKGFGVSNKKITYDDIKRLIEDNYDSMPKKLNCMVLRHGKLEIIPTKHFRETDYFVTNLNKAERHLWRGKAKENVIKSRLDGLNEELRKYWEE